MLHLVPYAMLKLSTTHENVSIRGKKLVSCLYEYVDFDVRELVDVSAWSGPGFTAWREIMRVCRVCNTTRCVHRPYLINKCLTLNILKHVYL